MLDIAIFGATSTVAKEYIQQALLKSHHKFFLFSRNPKWVSTWFNTFQYDRDRLIANSYSDFSVSRKFDVIINFVGRGDPTLLRQENTNFLIVNDFYDNKILHYLTHHESSKYLYISSGASYLSTFDRPIDEGDQLNIDLNRLRSFDLYSVSKQLSEVKHRKLTNLKIVDLRIFCYLQSADIASEGSLLGCMFSSIKKGEEFKTNSIDIYRDYINSELFYDAVECILAADSMNCGLDLYSKSPTSKLEILKMLSSEFGLNYSVDEKVDLINFSLTGLKKNYYSVNKSMENYGYSPHLSSICMIRNEAKKNFNTAPPNPDTN